jgi:hypothetical protein
VTEKAVGAGLHMRRQRRVLRHAHANHVDDFALIGGNALIEKRDVGASRVFGARDMAALHRLARNFWHRLAGNARIDVWQGLLPLLRRYPAMIDRRANAVIGITLTAIAPTGPTC